MIPLFLQSTAALLYGESVYVDSMLAPLAVKGKRGTSRRDSRARQRFMERQKTARVLTKTRGK